MLSNFIAMSGRVHNICTYMKPWKCKLFFVASLSSAAEMEKRPAAMVANLLFLSCSQYLSNVWRPLLGALECYCFALMKKLKMSAKCIPSQIELSNQNISSGREDLLDFLTVYFEKTFETSTETFSPNSFLFQRYIQTKNRQTLHTTYICMIHLYLQQNNLKFAVRARRWHAVVVGWEKYCLNNLARELTTCLRSGG